MTIDDIEFHDLGVDKIELNFKDTSVSFFCPFFNEEKQDYDHKILQFKQVKNLKVGEIEAFDTKDIEIFSADITHTGDYYTIFFTLLSGFSKPSFEISFDYKESAVLDRL